MGEVRLQRESFSVDDVLRELSDPRAGGVNVYVGSVRGDDDGRAVEALEYEAYPEMARTVLERLRAEAVERFGLLDATVVHRIGRLHAGEPILLVALSGRHRKETYAAMDFFMDQLKAVVPIWKQEQGRGGGAWILGAERRGADP